MAGTLDIVGVVGDVRHDNLQAEAEPELFVPFVQLPLSEMHLVIHTLDDPTRVVSAVRQEVRRIDPQLPLTRVATIDELLSVSVAQPRFNMALLVGLAFCALALAAVGVYGVVSYSVTRRTREIGVRMALGASAGDTVWLVVGQSLRVIAIGVVVGVAGAMVLARFIRGMLFGVGPSDPVTYVTVGAALLLVGMASAAFPARRAAGVDPVEALRVE
jgi:putative ABC transport system permease protein